jgi:uncharacterized protein (TIGR03089 family)
VSDIWSRLQARTRAMPGTPLVTFIDATTGERTELSSITVANAAAKIANALRDEFDLGPGDVVSLQVPAHWQRTAWCAGAWTAGCVVAVDGRPGDLVVAGPEEAATASGPVAVVSLHPFGLPITTPLPAGTDVTLAVRQQPDAYLYDPPSADEPALLVDDGALSHSEVLALATQRAAQWGLAPGGRLLADDAATGLDAWLAALAVPLAIDGSTVLVRGDGASIAEQEHVTARVR